RPVRDAQPSRERRLHRSIVKNESLRSWICQPARQTLPPVLLSAVRLRIMDCDDRRWPFRARQRQREPWRNVDVVDVQAIAVDVARKRENAAADLEGGGMNAATSGMDGEMEARGRLPVRSHPGRKSVAQYVVSGYD